MRPRRHRVRSSDAVAPVTLDDVIDPGAFDDELDGVLDGMRKVTGAPSDDAPSGTGKRSRRRGPLLIAAACALVLAGMAVVDVVAERLLTARVIEQPGGILPLDGPVEELWSVPVDDESLMALPGLLVTTEDGRLVARNLDDGTVAWRTDEIGSVVCSGPSRWTRTGLFVETPERLVCVVHAAGGQAEHSWRGSRPAERIVLVEGDGAVVEGAESLEVDGRLVTVTSGGVLVRAERTGPAGPVPEGVEVDPATGDVTGEATLDGRDVRVVAQDPVTGDVLWSETVPFAQPGDVSSCVIWKGESEGNAFDLDGVGLVADGLQVAVRGCGIAASYDEDGTRLDDPESMSWVVGAVGGYVARHTWDEDSFGETSLVAPDGSVRWSTEGAVALPGARDGRGVTVVPVRREDGLRGLDLDGRELWAEDGYRSVGSVLAHVDGTIVYALHNTVVAIEAETGAPRWESANEVANGATPYQGLTDGRALVVVEHDQDASMTMRALALQDGAELWSTALTPGGEVYVLAGRMFYATDGRFIRLG